MTNLLTDDFDENTVPQKFKEPESGAVRVQALVNSYNELEKKMSSSPGAPKSHEEYCIECQHGMFEPDAEVNRRLHSKGMTQEQVQEVYDLAAEKLVPMIMELTGDFQADREVEKLIEHFGGPQAWRDVSRQLLAYGQQNLPGDVLENLSSSYEGVLALYRMMKTGEPGFKKQGAQATGGANEKELQSMMRDPKYWRDRDPAYVSKVTEGFQKMYGE